MYDGPDAVVLAAPPYPDTLMVDNTYYPRRPDGTIIARPWHLAGLLAQGCTAPLPAEPPADPTPAYDEPDPVPATES